MKKKATQILKDTKQKYEASQIDEVPSSSQKSFIRSRLFKRYRSAKQPLTQCAISYLLKNNCKIPKQPEDPQKFAQRRRKSELQVKRIQEQLEARIPKGRDLTSQAWLSTLLTATSTVPKDNQEHKRWQSRLLTKPRTIPFPILFETNEDLSWSLNSKGRLCVHFNGLREHTFQIYCDQRQLPWFKRFLEDQQTKRTSKNKHSSALFTLRSARISWQEIDTKGHPWDNHCLTLSCTVDKRLWSAEGTEEVRQEKAADTAKILTRLNEKDSLSKTQVAYARRLTSTLERLESSFDRPSQPRYQGQSQIIVGLSLGWDSPLTLAIWKSDTQEILVYRSLRQLLAKDYPLFLKQRREQQKQSHQRHKAQCQGKGNQFGTSNLGQHIDRWLAKAVVKTAKQYDAGSIAIPSLDNIRDILQTEIDARAEQKIPGYVEAQKRYTKQYKKNIHKWSYGRLLDQITSKASQENLAIEKSKQPLSGTSQAKAKSVAINAYESRNIVH
ncbi:type V CRISPR-associated protein Cas12k [Leptothoe kymatousa]|uniref:type V CRISPR-associated protein Cas12k n=1 Tax=Leptothoe kymatousa TaxID=2651727 RepID=UPI002DD6500F|nr:type V CRISPR-associated protein Cas12k [Leptothoe kymatousa]